MTRQIENWKHDQRIREGVEYHQPFWDLIPAKLRMWQLESEFERSVLANEMNEFHRRVFDNDKPGRRHMLPFYWRNIINAAGEKVPMKVPITMASPAFNARWAAYEARIKELKRRAPDYGR